MNGCWDRRRTGLLFMAGWSNGGIPRILVKGFLPFTCGFAEKRGAEFKKSAFVCVACSY
jgi:hypothetical protein